MLDNFQPQSMLLQGTQANLAVPQQLSLNFLPNGSQSIQNIFQLSTIPSAFLMKNQCIQQEKQQQIGQYLQEQQQQLQQAQILILQQQCQQQQKQNQQQHQQASQFLQQISNGNFNSTNPLQQFQKLYPTNEISSFGSVILSTNHIHPIPQSNQLLNPQFNTILETDQYRLTLLNELLKLDQQKQQSIVSQNQQTLARQYQQTQQQLLQTQQKHQLSNQQLQQRQSSIHSQQKKSKLSSPILQSSNVSSNEITQLFSPFPQPLCDSLDSKTVIQNVSVSGGSPHALEELKTQSQAAAGWLKTIGNIQNEEAEKKRKERLEKIERYKNKRRNWLRKVSYDCRKKVADSRLRIKGRFISKKDTLKIKELVGENDDAFNDKKNLRLDYMNSKMSLQNISLNTANSKNEILFQIEKLLRKNLQIHSQQTMNGVVNRIQNKQQIFCLLQRKQAEMAAMDTNSHSQQESESSMLDDNSL